MTGDISYESDTTLPPDTYRIASGHKQPGGKHQYIVATPLTSIWAGANEATQDTTPNAIFARIEVDCDPIRN